MGMTLHIVLWVMMAAQMAAWAWMQIKGGKLPDRSYVTFCALMMVGQIGAGIECFLGHAWGTFVIQAYFFVFTGWGGMIRYIQMRRNGSGQKS
jgi:fatty acid desaturase